MTIYYKFLDKNGLSPFARRAWRLPENDAPGKWMPKLRGKLIPCEKGYHACPEQDLAKWLAPTLYELEYEGRVVEDYDKVLGRKARLVRKVDTWNDRTARLFAADCAERVLPLFEQRYPGDDRPRQAIAAARAFANGEIDAVALAAAQAAAWDAVPVANADWDIAALTARNAAMGATQPIAIDAAMFASDNAVCAATLAADMSTTTWNTVYGAAIEWQSQRLLQYLRGEIG